MSHRKGLTDLPTEEDVLARLVLYGARPLVTNCDSTEQIMEQAAWRAAVAFPRDAPLDAVAIIAGERLESHGSVEAAIANSERRLEVERATGALIMAAEEWRDCPTMLASSGLEDAVDRLRAAEGR